MGRAGTGFGRIAGTEGDVPSPTGRLAAIETGRGIKIVTAKGRKVRLLRVHLTPDQFYDGNLVWSPDSRYLAFAVANDEADFVRTYVARTDGRTPIRIITRKKTGHYEYPMSWSPDDRRLLVDVDSSGRVVILDSIARDGSHRRRIASRVNPSGAHAWAPDGHSIAYVGWKRDIFIVSGQGGKPRRVVATKSRGKAASRVWVTWSPHSSELAFSDVGGIFVIRQNGRGLYRINAFGDFPEWSPQGSTIAFDGRGSIYSVESSGRGLRQLTDSSRDDSSEWSPDGSRIVFIRGSSGLRVADEIGVYVIDASGKRLSRLGTGYDPHWSPDGRSVLYLHETGKLGGTAIMIAAADASSTRKVAEGVGASWSPSGTTIAFMRYDYRQEDHGAGGIVTVAYRSTLYVSAIDGSNRRALASRSLDANNELYDGSSWSPDGRSIALTASRDEGSSIVLVDPVTGQTRTLDKSGTDAYQVAWSPDGTHLAFTGISTLGVVDADGTGGRVLLDTHFGANLDNAVWSSDGASLAYIRCVELPSEYQSCDLFTMHADGTNRRQLTRTVGIEGAVHWSGSPPAH
jgi:Tol biopolymer transport system component